MWSADSDDEPSYSLKAEYRRRTPGSQEIVLQYKLSIKQKYESEWSSLSGERESLSALYNEPVIIQMKDENGSFENISVDKLLISHGTKTVILQGDSGIGKSFIAQKIMLNWASELSIQFYVVFYLKCEELMCFSEEMNLIELLSYSCSLASDQISQMLQQPPEKILFIIDGFDELRLTQAIFDMSPNSNPLQKAPPEVILCSLLRGYLIPETNLLVTTRTKITVKKLLRKQPCFTEIMGFSEKKVETYLQTFFSKEYDCVRANESLLTACSIPVICWIVSEMFRLGADVSSELETTTSIYVGFVSTLLDLHCQGLSQPALTLLRSLGQLAERGMLEQQVLFDEKNVDEIISDPDGNPFLCRFLSKRRIRQETIFSFMYHSFQEFFTALYYVLLDAEESQRKVRELLHTVERGWALSFWSDRDFSMADVEVRQSNLLQPVILFLCGLGKKDGIPSFFEKLNVVLSISVETHLKEWIIQCSQRYQNEHMLFILHCLYELHEKSFIRKVLENLILIDLSNTPLKMADCWVLKYCLQCCEHIRNLKLHVTSDNLKMLQPDLSRCKELWLIMDHISDDVVGLVSAAAEGKNLNELNINKLDNYGKRSGYLSGISVSVRDGDITLSFSKFTSAVELTLTSPHSFISTINWVKSYGYLQNEDGLLTFLQSVSDLKKVCLQNVVLTESYSSEIMSLIKACPSLIELSINVTDQLMLEKLQSMKTSMEKMGWTLTVWGKLSFLEPNMERFTERKLKKQKKARQGKVLRRLSLLFKRTPRRQFVVMGSQEIVLQYKLSIKQKYESEWSSLSGERESLSALYNEPVIIQMKDENGSFENISVDKLLISHGTKTVILQGDSGIGKSFIAQKIMLNWASELSIQFYVVFYLRCEELMCFSEEMNLIELLSYSCSLASDQISQMLQQPPEKILFIIDGFDELRLTQTIFDMSPNSNPLQKAPPEVILCSLLRGYLIPETNLLVTTRTKNTVNKLLRKQPCFTEIMGFSEKKVETYLQTFFSKEYDCVRANESLLTACSIPVICWIVSEMFRLGADVSSELETTTSIYVGFVSTLLEHHCQGLNQPALTLLRSLGQLAERGMLEQQVLFDEKNVDEIISDPVANPFLCRFLSKRIIRQETIFSFIYHSFQEFFTALYYVLLDAEESQRKVRELLHTVERGWALSFWSDRDFSMADVEVRQSNLLQPVILFLCGLGKKDGIPSFFEKLNVVLSISVETHLKEWIIQCSQRYQNEHMLFILHCLYELHEKSFIRKVLENLILIDLSNTPLKMADCWVLKYCLQCCEHIRNLKLHVTSDNLKMLQPDLSRCKELWLIMDHISDDVVGLVSAAAEGKNLNELNINKLDNYGKRRGYHPEITVSVRDGDITLSFSEFLSSATELTLTSPHSIISTINWVKSQNKMSLFSYRYLQNEDGLLTFLQSVSDLKKVCLQDVVLTESYSSEIMSLIKACPSLIELRINVTHQYMLEKLQSMKTSLEKMGWTLTVWGKLALLKLNKERFTEGKMKTKQEKTKSRIEVEESSDSVLKAESSTYSFSEDVEVFTPVLSGDEDKLKNTYRFVCAHAGQFRCSLTNLVFVMEGEGEVLYRVVSWDPRLLDGLGQMRPAGPLYDIDCSAKSVLRLHLPHCVIFSEENKDGLAVAHFTGGNVEIIHPLRVTETHVIIDIRDLSRFGLIWIKTIFGYPIDGQVLLFLRPVTVEQEQKILNVHLLPGNVPVTEVQCFHHNKSYIETSSKCCLFTDRQYSLCCQPENCEVQPMSEIFQLVNFGPNYHPTFEVFLDVNIKEVKLGVVDKTEDGKEVWPRRRILLTAPSKGVEPPAHQRIPETEFVNTHGDKLTQRVSSVMAIADSLKTKKIIAPEMWSKIHVEKTPQEKMRCLLIALESGGDNAKVEFCRLLKENEPGLVKELGPHL